MPCSGCSALHGVNPNLKKKKSLYIIGRTIRIGTYNNVLGGDSLASGSFCFITFKVFSVKGKIPFDMFSVKSLSALLTLHLPIIFFKFKNIFSSFISFLLIFILSWIVSPSCNKLLIPSSNNFKRLLSHAKWPLWLRIVTRFLK